MNNNELRLSELTNGILLIERLMKSTVDDTDKIEQSEYYPFYKSLIDERKQLLKELNREECRI